MELMGNNEGGKSYLAVGFSLKVIRRRGYGLFCPLLAYKHLTSSSIPSDAPFRMWVKCRSEPACTGLGSMR